MWQGSASKGIKKNVEQAMGKRVTLTDTTGRMKEGKGASRGTNRSLAEE